MTTQDMTAMSDILDCFRYFAGVGLKSVPSGEDADVWLRVLSDVPASLLHLAADEWIRTPVTDKGGTLRGQRWSPTAGELRSLAFSLEADHRVQVTKRKRGCASCGEIVGENMEIVEHGTGYRTISQHCYPKGNAELVDWHAEPYRVASRLVLCDCDLGSWIEHNHQTADRDRLPKSWTPTITCREAVGVFARHDARLYLSGSMNPRQRFRPEDARTSSPFFCRASPEELHGDNEYSRALRKAAYDYLRGTAPAPVIADIAGAMSPSH